MKSKLLFVMAAAVAMQMSRGLAVTIGQIDDFEDGTTQGWFVGLLGAVHPAPPANIPDNGPAGLGDNYLQLTSVGGSGAGNRLTAINGSQWTGDYLSSHVNAISMDVRNLGNSDLHLRLFVADPVAGPPLDGAVSTVSLDLPAGLGWTSVFFSLSPESLTAVFGDVTLALKNAGELRIINSATATYPGDTVVAQLGVDNIRALSVPEPSCFLTIVAAAAGLTGFSFLSRNRGKQC